MSEAQERPIEAAAKHLVKAGRAWGMREGNPEADFLEGMERVLVALESSMHDVAAVAKRVSQPDREALFRAARAASATAIRASAEAWVAQALRRSAAWIGAGVAAALVAGAIGGFVAGRAVTDRTIEMTAAELQTAFSTGTRGADFLAGIALRNNADRLASDCERATYAQAGGRACVIRVWVDPPPTQ